MLNDTFSKTKQKELLINNKNISFIQDNNLKKILYKIFIYVEKFLKFIFLTSPRETFTIGLLGFDITKVKEYQKADVIHIHWLSQGFINNLSNNKPVVWTKRYVGFTGPHTNGF